MSEESDFSRDLKSITDSAFDLELILSLEQREIISTQLVSWIKARSNVTDFDSRLVLLVNSIPNFVAGLTFELSEDEGIKVIPKLENRSQLLMERGAVWLRGGDWWNVVVTCVSIETLSKP